jgi:hypothetical protein
METLGLLAVVLGFILVVAGHLGTLVAGFRENFLWGLVMLVFPILQMAFLVLHWDRAKKPFFLVLWGAAFITFGVIAAHGVFIDRHPAP